MLRLASLITAVFLLGVGTVQAGAGDEVAHFERHPADGPDIDLRWVIEGRLVRLELVLNLALMDELVDVAREDEEVLHPLETDAAKEALVPCLAAGHRMRIDGVAVAPEWREFTVAEPEFNLLPLFPRYGLRALTKVRVVFDYPTLSEPKEVALQWNLYPPDRVRADAAGATPPMEINGRLLADGAESVLILKSERPEHVWQASEAARAARFLTVPDFGPAAARPLWLQLWFLCAVGGTFLALGVWMHRLRPRLSWIALGAALCVFLIAMSDVPLDKDASAAEIPDAALIRVFEPLHTNLYRAFGYQEESSIYDALARSLTGRSLLEQVYGEVYGSLVLAEEGGAVSTVLDVRHKASTITTRALDADPPRFSLRAQWEVDGIVRHFGHAHWRTNAYEANYELERTAAGWRIRSSEILASERLASGTNDPSRAEAQALPDAARR